MAAALRLVLCMAFCIVSGLVIVNGSLVSASVKYQLLSTIPGIIALVITMVICAIALYNFVESQAIEAMARFAAKQRQWADHCMMQGFQRRVQEISDGQQAAAEADFERRTRAVAEANNGQPLPNRRQWGSEGYGY